MRTFFRANTSDARCVAFFFNASDVNKANLVENIERRYLTLGGDLSEWKVSTMELTDNIYKNLIYHGQKFIHLHSSMKSPGEKESEILFGHIFQYVAMCLARSLCQLETIEDDIRVESADLEFPSFSFRVPQNSSEALKLVTSGEFSTFVNQISLQKKFGSSTGVSYLACWEDKDTKQFKSSVKIGLLATQSLILKIWPSEKYLLTGTYMSPKSEVLVSLLLGQAPRLLGAPSNRPSVPDGGFLDARSGKIAQSSSLDNIIEHLVKITAPVSLVEKYTETLERAGRFGFPKRPKVIFTASSFFSDDLFKCVVAQNTQTAGYIVGQHGALFGTSMLRHLLPERNACTQYLCWGRGLGEKDISIGMTKPMIKRKKFPRSRKILIVVRPENAPNYVFADMSYLNQIYLTKIISLIEFLDQYGVEVVVKLHPSKTLEIENLVRATVSNLKNVQMAEDGVSFGNFVREGYGIVFTYDSTGMLEMAASKLPFFFFAAEGLGMIEPEFKINYHHLDQAGLLETNARRASKLIKSWLEEDVSNKKFGHALSDFARGIVSSPKRKHSRIVGILRQERVRIESQSLHRMK